MPKSITDFILNGKGVVTLQVTTLITLMIITWTLSDKWTSLEHSLEQATKNRWTSVDMALWSSTLAKDNKSLRVPEVKVD